MTLDRAITIFRDLVAAGFYAEIASDPTGPTVAVTRLHHVDDAGGRLRQVIDLAESHRCEVHVEPDAPGRLRFIEA